MRHAGCGIIRARFALILILVAAPAFELHSDSLLPLVFIEHPWSRFDGRPVPQMLMVAASEQRSPMAFIVSVE